MEARVEAPAITWVNSASGSRYLSDDNHNVIWRSSDKQLYLLENCGIDATGAIFSLDQNSSMYVLVSFARTEDVRLADDFLQQVQQVGEPDKLLTSTTSPQLQLTARVAQFRYTYTLNRLWGAAHEVFDFQAVCDQSCPRNISPVDVVYFTNFEHHAVAGRRTAVNRYLIYGKESPALFKEHLGTILGQIEPPMKHTSSIAVEWDSEESTGEQTLRNALLAYSKTSFYGKAKRQGSERYSTIAAIISTCCFGGGNNTTLVGPSWCLYRGIVTRNPSGHFHVNEPKTKFQRVHWYTKIYSDAEWSAAAIASEGIAMEKIEWALRPCGKPCAGDLVFDFSETPAFASERRIIPQVPGDTMRYFTFAAGSAYLHFVQDVLLLHDDDQQLVQNYDAIKANLRQLSPKLGFCETDLVLMETNTEALLFFVGCSGKTAFEEIAKKYKIHQKPSAGPSQHVHQWTYDGKIITLPTADSRRFQPSDFFDQRHQRLKPIESLLPCTEHTLSKFFLGNNPEFMQSFAKLQDLKRANAERRFDVKDLLIVNNRIVPLTFSLRSDIGEDDFVEYFEQLLSENKSQCPEEAIGSSDVRRRRREVVVTATHGSTDDHDYAPAPFVHSQLLRTRLPVLPSYLLPMRHSRSRSRHSRSRSRRSRSRHSRSRHSRSRRSRSRRSRSRSRTHVPRSRLS